MCFEYSGGSDMTKNTDGGGPIVRLYSATIARKSDGVTPRAAFRGVSASPALYSLAAFV